MNRFNVFILLSASLFFSACRNTTLGNLGGNSSFGGNLDSTSTGNGGTVGSGGSATPQLPAGLTPADFGSPSVSYSAQPVLSMSSNQFGDVNVGSSVRQTAVIANFGLNPIFDLSIQLNPSTHFVLVGNDCPASLGGLESCTLTISFSPRSEGNLTAALHLDGSNVGELNQPLYGTGIQRHQRLGAGQRHACGITRDGVLKCWGDNNFGQLGTGNNNDRHTPETVLNIGAGVNKMTGGQDHSCAIREGSAYCWGRNDLGQVGRGDREHSYVPVQVSGLSSGVSDIASSYFSNCAVANGDVYCWGYNVHGEVGIGNTSRQLSPVRVPNLPVAAARVAMGAYHSCALLTDGTVWCWGYNGHGQLGDDSKTRRTSPVQVSGLASAVDVFAAHDQSCAIKSDGSLHCWGEGAGYALGNDNTRDQKTPIQVLEDGVTSAALGVNHGCAIRNGDLLCWGLNEYAQLGDGTRSRSKTPIQIVDSAFSPVLVVSTWYSTYALLDDLAFGWGYGGDGRLGNGSTSISLSPALIPLD